jgi:MerR family mercuric resistance operon transcriptional regulator
MGAITASRAEGLAIGKLSELSGVNIETIRYYEKIGILPRPSRAKNGRRVYGPGAVRLVAFVRRSRELGFPLDEVRSLLRLGAPEKASCGEVREIGIRHLNVIRAKLADLKEFEALLTAAVTRCSGSSSTDCPILDVLDGALYGASSCEGS